jgi:hypothetical protein
MRHKTIALFMLVGMISAGTLFAGQASAKNTSARDNSQVKGAIAQTARLSTNSASALSSNYSSGLAIVTFQNYTPWKVQCYVDGTFVGVVYPGRTLSSWTVSGWTRPYAQAVFVDGSSLRWDLGNVFYVPGGSYAFPLFP